MKACLIGYSVLSAEEVKEAETVARQESAGLGLPECFHQWYDH